jgi:hypothetical protein
VEADITIAQEFFRSRGIEWRKLVDFARRASPDTGVLLVGSIPEGLAVAESDVDILLLGGRHEDLMFGHGGHDTSVDRDDSGTEFNAEHWTDAALSEVANRLAISLDAIKSPVHVQRIERLPEDEMIVMHRIRTGVPIANADVARLWRKRLRGDELPSFLAFHWTSEYFALKRDIIGQMGCQREDAGLYMLGLALQMVAGFVLASVGETNPKAKWRVSLLQRHRHLIGEELADPLLEYLSRSRGMSAADVKAGLELSQRALTEATRRHPELLAPMRELSKHVKRDLNV